MLPLQLLRIFDYQQPKVDSGVLGTPNKKLINLQVPEAPDTLPVERRVQADRRLGERRERQQATFLNTRKTQGRRRSPGRRASDLGHEIPYKPISIQG